MNKKAILLGCLLLSACDNIGPLLTITDQEKRHRYFQECLTALPAGPDNTKYNDWDEVVEECGHQAYYQSIVGYTRDPMKQVK